MTNDDLKHLSLDALFEQFAITNQGTAAGIKRACAVLLEIHHRGEHHTYMRSELYKHYKAICDGRLSAEAALGLAGHDAAIEAIMGLPHSVQNRLVMKEKIVPLVTFSGGKFHESTTTLMSVSEKDLPVVFGDGGMRSHAAQREILRDRDKAHAADQAPPPRIGRVEVDVARRELILGRMKLRPDELIEPLRLLGFKMVALEAPAARKRAA